MTGVKESNTGLLPSNQWDFKSDLIMMAKQRSLSVSLCLVLLSFISVSKFFNSCFD